MPLPKLVMVKRKTDSYDLLPDHKVVMIIIVYCAITGVLTLLCDPHFFGSYNLYEPRLRPAGASPGACCGAASPESGWSRLKFT